MHINDRECKRLEETTMDWKDYRNHGDQTGKVKLGETTRDWRGY